MDDEAIARSNRAARRAQWPGGRYRLGEEPAEPTLDPTEALASMRELSLRAWRLTGQPLPSYARAEMPGRVIRGSSR